MKNTTIFFALVALVAISMTSCNKEQEPQQEIEIGFTACIANMEDSIMPETKTINAEASSLELVISESAYPEAVETKSIKRNTTVSDIDLISVSCVNLDKDKPLAERINFAFKRYRLSTKQWLGDTKYYFHGNPKEKLTFYAGEYIQGHVPVETYSWHLNPQSGASVEYAVPVTQDNQLDIIAATATATANSSENVQLNFHHLMTGINFVDKVKTAGGQIHRIKLVNVFSKGTYYFSSTWTNLSTQTTYTLQKADDASYTTADNEIDFLLMPQTFSEESTAYIEIIYNLKKGGLLESARFPLASTHAWESGKVVTYTISLTK